MKKFLNYLSLFRYPLLMAQLVAIVWFFCWILDPAYGRGQGMGTFNTNVTYTNIESFPSAAYYVSEMKRGGRTKDVVKLLIADGSVCEANGHLWNCGNGIISAEAVYPAPIYRVCALCGLKQKQTTVWK